MARKTFFFFKKMLYTYIIDCWVSVCLGWDEVFLMLSSTSIEGSLTGVRPFVRWMFIYLHDGRRGSARCVMSLRRMVEGGEFGCL